MPARKAFALALAANHRTRQIDQRGWFIKSKLAKQPGGLSSNGWPSGDVSHRRVAFIEGLDRETNDGDGRQNTPDMGTTIDPRLPSQTKQPWPITLGIEQPYVEGFVFFLITYVLPWAQAIKRFLKRAYETQAQVFVRKPGQTDRQ